MGVVCAHVLTTIAPLKDEVQLEMQGPSVLPTTLGCIPMVLHCNEKSEAQKCLKAIANSV